MLTPTLSQLTRKIRQEYCLPPAAAQTQAAKILQGCPAALQDNVRQWCFGQTLTDIPICGYSIPMLFAIWNRADFLEALDILTQLETGNPDAERRIWQTRR